LDATGLRQARGVALSQGLVGGGPWAQPARLLGGRGGISLGPVRRPAQGIGVPGGGGGLTRHGGLWRQKRPPHFLRRRFVANGFGGGGVPKLGAQPN
jgi:hypothetical protein